MSPTDYLWLYISVPAIIVSVLVLIQLRQKRMSRLVDNTFREKDNEKEVHAIETQDEDNKEHSECIHDVQQQEAKASNDANKPENCPHYLGYLYLRKASDRTHLPNECYNCRKLL